MIRRTTINFTKIYVIFIIRIMVFPLDDNFVFGDNFFFLADNFFFAEGDKKNYSAKKKKLLTNKRSYSSNGNTFMPMIWIFYANPFLYFLGVPKTFLKCWGFLLRTNNKTNFNDVCSVSTPTPKIEISMISAAVYWKYIPTWLSILK